MGGKFPVVSIRQGENPRPPGARGIGTIVNRLLEFRVRPGNKEDAIAGLMRLTDRIDEFRRLKSLNAEILSGLEPKRRPEGREFVESGPYNL
jgi:hypothetical protein